MARVGRHSSDVDTREATRGRENPGHLGTQIIELHELSFCNCHFIFRLKRNMKLPPFVDAIDQEIGVACFFFCV